MNTINTALMQSNNPQNHLGSDCQSCLMRIVTDTGLENCLMEAIRSQWATPFGDSSYCKHPSAQQVVNFVNSNQL